MNEIIYSSEDMLTLSNGISLPGDGLLAFWDMGTDSSLNMLPIGSDSFTTGTWTKWDGSIITITSGQPDPDGGNNAYRIQGTNGNRTWAYKYLLDTYFPANSPFYFCVWAKTNSGSAGIGINATAMGADNTVTLTSEWVQHRITSTGVVATPQIRVLTSGTTYGFDITLYRPKAGLGLVDAGWKDPIGAYYQSYPNLVSANYTLQRGSLSGSDTNDPGLSATGALFGSDDIVTATLPIADIEQRKTMYIDVVSGTFSGEINNATGVKWTLPNATELTTDAINTAVTSGRIKLECDDFAKNNVELYFYGCNATRLNVADLPRGLRLLYAKDCTLLGNALDIPRTLNYLFLNNITSGLVGSIADMPKPLNYLFLQRAYGITGSLDDMDVPKLTTGIHIMDSPGISGAPRLFHASNTSIRIFNSGQSPTDTDNCIIRLDAAGGVNGGATFENNRTSASDAARASLISRGWTVSAS